MDWCSNSPFGVAFRPSVAVSSCSRVRSDHPAGLRVSAMRLGNLASVEFVIQKADTAGGPGANFLVRWAGAPDIDEPVIEAVMIGPSGSAGFSFTSVGRVVKDPPSP